MKINQINHINGSEKFEGKNPKTQEKMDLCYKVNIILNRKVYQ